MMLEEKQFYKHLLAKNIFPLCFATAAATAGAVTDESKKGTESCHEMAIQQ